MANDQIEEQYRAKMNELARGLDQFLRPAGFALLVFAMDDKKKVNYISNAHRQDIYEAMKEFLRRNGQL